MPNFEVELISIKGKIEKNQIILKNENKKRISKIDSKSLTDFSEYYIENSKEFCTKYKNYLNSMNFQLDEVIIKLISIKLEIEKFTKIDK